MNEKAKDLIPGDFIDVEGQVYEVRAVEEFWDGRGKIYKIYLKNARWGNVEFEFSPEALPQFTLLPRQAQSEYLELFL